MASQVGAGGESRFEPSHTTRFAAQNTDVGMARSVHLAPERSTPNRRKSNMSNSMNKVFLLGNLGADPELRDFDGNAKLRFRLATSFKWRDRDTGEMKEKTEWHTLAMWGKRAEALATILTKGSRVMIEGRLETRSYEVDGITKYSTEIKVDDLFLAGRPQRGRPEVDYGTAAA